MTKLLTAIAIASLSIAAAAQDKVTLANGDVVSGTVASAKGGELTIKSPLLGDVVIKIANIDEIVTQDAVTLKTKAGDTWNRRIVGIENASLKFAAGDAAPLPLDDLDMINPPPKKEPKWTGSLKFTGIQTSGNTQRRQAGLLFDMSRTSEQDRISVDAQWDYAEDNPTAQQRANAQAAGNPLPPGARLTQRRTGAGVKYDYFLSDRSYLLATSRVLGDTIANLDLRFTAGAGVGYTLIDDGTALFLFEVGLSYLDESYRMVMAGQPSSTDYLSARVAYRYERELSEDTKLIHRVEAYPSVEDKRDFYGQMTTELSTSLTESMVASVSHVLDYDNTPAPGFKRMDNRVILSVGWSF